MLSELSFGSLHPMHGVVVIQQFQLLQDIDGSENSPEVKRNPPANTLPPLSGSWPEGHVSWYASLLYLLTLPDPTINNQLFVMVAWVALLMKRQFFSVLFFF